MKKSRKRKVLTMMYLNLGLVVTTSASLVYTTLAWFSSTRRASIEVQSITVAVQGFRVTGVKRYHVSAINTMNGTTSFTFVNTNAEAMPIYDKDDIYYSPYKRAIVVHVSYDYDGDDNVFLYAKTAHDIFSFGEEVSFGPGGVEAQNDVNFTSNCFQFTPLVGPSSLNFGWSSATASYLYDGVGQPLIKSFVTINSGTDNDFSRHSKTTSLQIMPISTSEHDLWYVIEYNEAAMQYIDLFRLNLLPSKIVLYNDDISLSVDK